jgi:MSHA pilin protein MshC
MSLPNQGVGGCAMNDELGVARRLSAQRGFTLVELVVTLIVVGILAVTAIPRFANKADFDARGFFDATASILRYAQKSAVAQRRTVCVAFGADSSVTLTIAGTFGSACNTDLAGPNGTAPHTLAALSGVGFAAAPANFSFLPSGEASLGQIISVAELPGRSITVVAATGYVQEN